MLKFMLDTNIVIYVIKRRPVELLDVFNRYTDQMCISSITLAELIHGVEKSSHPEKNMKRVEDFISRLEVLSYDNEAAMHYGDIRADLERKGTPIGVNDLHIAGHARSRGLMVVTNNTKEFSRVEGLRITDWTDGNS
jgi:tRNA(fMet)-specific endonuclease VapC